MQALQMSGQATEFRDPLPVREPASGEVDNSEHPFMKLLARLRTAMKQAEELAQGAAEESSKLDLASFAKAKSLKSSADMKGVGQELSDAAMPGAHGLQLAAVKATTNGAATDFDMRGQKMVPGTQESSHANAKGRTLSSVLGVKTARNTGKGEGTEAVPGFQPGKSSGAVVDGASVSGFEPGARKKLPGLGDNGQDTPIIRGSSSSSEALAKRQSMGAKGSLDEVVVAASGNLNGSINLAGLKLHQNSTPSRDKGQLGDTVTETKTSERRLSRYSVVDMRLKVTGKGTAQDVSKDGKTENKTGGFNAADLNRGGLSGTDAAGRQIGGDQPSSGVSELSKGTGAESFDKSPASFADNLASRLRDGGAMDIVRSAQIVLKDGDAGLIRLRLDPESLGGVKIELKMADKQISAKIIVESDLAGEAFRSSLDSLRDAFSSSGFETTSIEVEVRDGRAGTGDAGRDDTQNDGDQESQDLYAARKVEEFGDAVPSADAAYGRSGVIDLVV